MKGASVLVGYLWT